MIYTKQEIEEAKNRSIAEFFEKLGSKVDYVGSTEAHIRGYGGLYVHIAPDADYNKYIIFSQTKNGKPLGGRDLVSCICNVFDKSFPEAVKMALDGKSPTRRKYDYFRPNPLPDVPNKKNPQLQLPIKADNNNKVFAYLCKRGISPDLIQLFIKKRLLYQDRQGNAVFLHIKKGEPCGAEKHGTGVKSYTVGSAKFSDFEPSNRYIFKVKPYVAERLAQLVEPHDPTNENSTNRPLRFAGFIYEYEANIVCNKGDYSYLKRITDDLKEVSSAEFDRLNERVHSKLKNFKGKAAGTTASTYFEYRSGSPDKVYVFESAIDLMSCMQLHPEFKDCSFVSMGGLNPTIVKELLDKYQSVILCTDNPMTDKASAEFMRQFIDEPRIKSGTKSLRKYADKGIKDWNDLLLYELKKNNMILSIPQIAKLSMQAAQETISRAAELSEQEREFTYDQYR